MQRTGRKGHAMFRVVVQDSRRTPTSGKVVAQLGSYDPHSKNLTLDKERAQHYLDHGAQPSERVARLLKAEGVKLPGWVKLATKKDSPVRNADKRRSTRPPEPEAPAEEAASEPAEEATAEEPAVEATEETAAESTEVAEATEVAAKAPAEESTAEESTEADEKKTV
jgi:small subunit ribosomal protein S16